MSFLFYTTQRLFSSIHDVSTYCQKRLVKQCLSSAVDVDHLPLDNITITWGLRMCILELKDVRLRVDDLSKSFDLPPAVVPSKAVLGLVRISIPTIDSSAIIVELESVKLRIRFLSDAELANSLNKDARKGTKHDSHVAMSDAGFQSVVDSAPKEEKATLEAALPSVEGAFGTFIGSLQALFSDGTSSLIASIKNGALDRLQVKIKDASIRVDMDVPDVDGNSGDTPTIQTSAMLTINDFFLQDACSPLSNQDRAGGSIEKKRQVTFSHVQAFLVSDLDVFERHSRFTPTAPEQLGDSRYGPSSHGSPTSPRIPADIDLMMSQSTIFGQGDDEQHRGQDGNYIDEAMQSIRSTKRSDRVLQEISGNVSLNSTQVREDQMLKEDSGHSSQILSPAKPGSIGNGVSAQSMRDDPTDLRKTAGHTDMQASRISTHFPEGEKSMYMSTLSRAGEIEANRMEASSASNAMPRMPGAFGESVYHPPAHSDARTFGETPTKRYSYDAFDNTTKAAKRILNIDKISLSLATPTQQKDEGTTEDRSPSAQQVNEDDDHGSTMKDSTMSEAVMGFSVANPPMSVPRDQPNSMHGVRAHQAREKSATGSTQEGYSLDIGVPSIDVCFDTSCGWLAYKMIHQALTGLGGEEEVAPPSADNDATPITVNAKLSTFAFRFVESQPTSTLRPDELHPDQQHEIDPLATILHLTLKELQVHQEAFANEKALRLKVRKVTLGHGREDIISFNQGLRMRESIRDMSLTSQDDLSIDLSKTTEGTRVNVNTLPMQLMLNLSLLDETLGWFGGLSSILELGSSIASMSTAKEPYKAPAPRKSLGVRFTDDLPPKKAEPVGIANAVEVQPSCKVNVRLGGLITYLLGDQCSLKMETSAVKTVSRSTGIAVQVDKGRISGPYLGREFDSRDASGSIELGNVRIEFLYTPKESDLAQLLALLTPSRDRYNEDDDIMLDTLFRQRRKGAVLRVTFSTVKASLQELDDLKLLSSLGGDLDKLSRVAKYLPEDDRPGILTLLRVIQLDCGVSVNREVGDITSSLQDFEAAYVGIPSLMSSSVRTARLWRNKEEELLGPVLDDEQLFTFSRDPLPMIMARFVADEMEPTVKVKLWNLRLEYRVPTLMTMLGISDENSAEEFAVEMAKSVMHLADISDRQSEEELLSVDTSSGYDGPRKLAVDLRNCVIGLNPRNSPSRGLCVLTSAEFRGAIQEDLSTEATLNLKEASLMIIDDARNALTHIPSQTRLAPSQDYHAQVLKSLGYVSVCSVSSAGVAIKSMQISDDGEKALDVEIKDNLLLMETCADSTQTLITILSGLSLPTPPVKDLKYRTEVSPMSDVFRFVSSEVVGKESTSSPGSPISPLGGIPEETNIVEEADYVSDFPSPSSGTGATQGRVRQEHPPSTYNEPLIEEFDPTVSASSSVSSLDFKEDHFSRKPSVGGTAHRWNSTNSSYSPVDESKLQHSPLRIRVRDVLIIWNLFDGYDWQRTRDTISQKVQEVQAKANEKAGKRNSQADNEESDDESIVGDILFNSIYIDIPSNRDPQALPGLINHDIDDQVSETASYDTGTTITSRPNRSSSGVAATKGKKLKLARSKGHKMAFELKGVCADFVVLPPGSDETLSSLDVRIRDLEIFDRIPTSTWKKFATYMRDAGEREAGASMAHIELTNVRPVADLAASEIVLRATVLPLRLHVDQDALDFLSRFFEFKDDSLQPEIHPSEVPFVQRAEVKAIPVKLDFKPKRVDYGGLRSGRTTEFMNFFVLDEAEMVLSHVIIYGVSGFDKLGQMLNDIWMPDIKSNQLPGVLAGIAPIRPLVGVGSGLRNLVVIPMREYKKDGRIVRSMQKGAASFAKTTTNELLKLGAKVAIGTQNVLQNAENLLHTPDKTPVLPRDHAPPDGRWEDVSIDEDEKTLISLYADQPVSVIQGLRGGYKGLTRDLVTARNAIVAVPGEVVESGTATKAARAVLKRVPTIVLRPAIGASKAIGQTLLGANNSLDPKQRQRNEDKYKHH